MSGERVSVKNLIKTLPLPYRDSIVPAWALHSGQDLRGEGEQLFCEDYKGFLRINELRSNLKTDIQRRAHGVIPLLLFLLWFELISKPCVWCFITCLSQNVKWLRQWNAGEPSKLHEKLSQSLLVQIILALERHSGETDLRLTHSEAAEGETPRTTPWQFLYTCDLGQSHNLANCVTHLAHLEVLEGWGRPFRQQLVKYCQLKMQTAAKQTQITTADLNTIILAAFLGDQVQQSESAKILGIMLERLPTIRQHWSDLICEALFRCCSEKYEEHETLLQNLFFRVPSERFAGFCAAAARFQFIFPLISALPDQPEAHLGLSAHQVSRFCEYTQIKIALPKQITLLPFLIVWLQSTTVFDVDAFLKSLPSIPVLLYPASADSEETNFGCEIAECSLKRADHVMPQESYVKAFHELLIKIAEAPEPFKYLYVLSADADRSPKEQTKRYVDHLQKFAGLDDARCLGVTRFLHSGCLLDLISWFATNAHRISSSHLEWLRSITTQLTATGDSYSSLIADIIMFYLEEESAAIPKQPRIGLDSDEAQWLIATPSSADDYSLSSEYQVNRSVHISKLLAVLCDSGLFQLHTLISMIKFIMHCRTQVLSAKRDAQWRLEKRGSCEGFAMWVHCVETLLRQTVEAFVPSHIRQYYSPDMPDVDESMLRTSGDIFRDLRELADSVIAAVHTRALNFSGDLRLEEATLRCLHWCLIIHTTCSISLLSRIHQIWMIVENILESPIISKVAIRTCWEIMASAAIHAADFTRST